MERTARNETICQPEASYLLRKDGAMRQLTNSAILIALLLSFSGAVTGGANQTAYDFTVNDIDGNPVDLAQYKGKVAVLVNTASRCGFTPQYEGLQTLYSEYKDRGLVVLAFPANNFKGQEPGTDQEIKEFCKAKYDIDFPLFSKISVAGEDKHPLYQFLTSPQTNPQFAGEIGWNFNKFVIDREGKVVARFESKDKPEGPEVIAAVEKALAGR
jgi:glutathione peroxidase